MRSFPSTDLKQTLGDVLSAASREPVTITRHNKPRFVLMTVEAYELRHPSDTRTAVATSAMPEDHIAMMEEVFANMQAET